MPEDTAQNPTKKSGIHWKSFFVGFIIGLILGAILVWVGLWYFNKSCKVENSKTPAKTATSSSKAAVASPKTITLDKFTGILYDSGYSEEAPAGHFHTFTFSYPSNWAVTEDDSKNPNHSGHFYLIQGTNSFTLQLSEIAGGIGGACVDTTVPPDLVVSSEKITVNNQALYITVEGSVSKKEVKDAYVDIDPTQNCMEGVVLLKANQDINFVTKMSFAGTVDKDYFLNSPEYKSAKEILTSFQVLN
jgi:hypothetical protein